MNAIKMDKLIKFLKQERIDPSILPIESLIERVGYISLPLCENPTVIVEGIHIPDIYYVREVKANEVEVQTEEAMCVHDNRRYQLMELLSKNNDFLMLDKNLLVNKTKIRSYHSYMETICFNTDYDSKDAIKIRIVGIKMQMIKKMFPDRDVYIKSKPSILSCAATKKYSM